jgi:hypothetical protein
MTDRKVDKFATSGTPKQIKETREKRDPCNHPELRNVLPQCKKTEPSRAKRDDIYGPRDQ